MEEFGSHSFVKKEDGRLLFSGDYTNKENLLSWLISFREKAVLIEPAWLREEIHRILLKMQDNYKMEGKEG